jgi:hypothetical protein
MSRRWPTFFGGYRSILRTPPHSVNHYNPGLCETNGIEDKRERPPSPEDRETHKLVKRIPLTLQERSPPSKLPPTTSVAMNFIGSLLTMQLLQNLLREFPVLRHGRALCLCLNVCLKLSQPEGSD